MFVAYLQLFGTAFNSVKGQHFTSDTIFRLAVPVLIGVSLMNILPNAFSNLPTLLQPFFDEWAHNGRIDINRAGKNR
ncbi:hypothetical protein RCO48_20890 [Peribacillus frigoritolerans]|nr:hypothetical protein [Peribacillus frigoritolerans]